MKIVRINHDDSQHQSILAVVGEEKPYGEAEILFKRILGNHSEIKSMEIVSGRVINEATENAV